MSSIQNNAANQAAISNWQKSRNTRKNNAASVTERIGQDLKGATNPFAYEVKSGDTMWDIAKAARNSDQQRPEAERQFDGLDTPGFIDLVKEKNGIADANKIKAGTQLDLNVGSPSLADVEALVGESETLLADTGKLLDGQPGQNSEETLSYAGGTQATKDTASQFRDNSLKTAQSFDANQNGQIDAGEFGKLSGFANPVADNLFKTGANLDGKPGMSFQEATASGFMYPDYAGNDKLDGQVTANDRNITASLVDGQVALSEGSPNVIGDALKDIYGMVFGQSAPK